MAKMREFMQGSYQEGHLVQTAIDRDPVSLLSPNWRSVISKLAAPLSNNEPKRLLVQQFRENEQQLWAQGLNGWALSIRKNRSRVLTHKRP